MKRLASTTQFYGGDMGEKIKEARSWTDTVFTVLGGLGGVGFTVSWIGPRIAGALPWLAGVVRPIPVPAIAVALVPGLVAWIAFRIGRRRRAKPPIPEARIIDRGAEYLAPRVWGEAAPEAAVIMAIRSHDPRCRWEQILKTARTDQPHRSVREFEIAIESLLASQDVEEVFENHGGNHVPMFQLTGRGMAYAHAREQRQIAVGPIASARPGA